MTKYRKLTILHWLWVIGMFSLIVLMRVYGCNLPYISSEDMQRVDQCTKAHMVAKRLDDGRVTCFKP